MMSLWLENIRACLGDIWVHEESDPDSDEQPLIPDGSSYNEEAKQPHPITLPTINRFLNRYAYPSTTQTKFRLPPEIRILIYECYIDKTQLPRRIVNIQQYLDPDITLRAWQNERLRAPALKIVPKDAGCSWTETEDQSAAELLATLSEEQLLSIGHTWFPGGSARLNELLDSPLVTMEPTTPHSLDISTAPEDFCFFFDLAFPSGRACLTPAQTWFSFSRDVLYLRYDTFSHGNEKTMASLIRALRTGNEHHWLQVQHLAILWEPNTTNVQDDLRRILKCFRGLKKITLVAQHYDGEEDDYSAWTFMAAVDYPATYQLLLSKQETLSRDIRGRGVYETGVKNPKGISLWDSLRDFDKPFPVDLEVKVVVTETMEKRLNELHLNHRRGFRGCIRGWRRPPALD